MSENDLHAAAAAAAALGGLAGMGIGTFAAMRGGGGIMVNAGRRAIAGCVFGGTYTYARAQLRERTGDALVSWQRGAATGLLGMLVASLTLPTQRKGPLVLAAAGGALLETALFEIDLWRQWQIVQREAPELLPSRGPEAVPRPLLARLPPWFPIRQVDSSSRLEVLRQEVRDLEKEVRRLRALPDGERDHKGTEA